MQSALIHNQKFYIRHSKNKIIFLLFFTAKDSIFITRKIMFQSEEQKKEKNLSVKEAKHVVEI